MQIDGNHEQSIRAGNKATTIFVAYHFFPSSEVGAKRMSALARYLVAQRRTVAVLSAFAGLGAPATEISVATELANFDIARVPDTKSIVDTILVNGKKWFRRSASALRGINQNPSVGLESAEADHRQGGSVFRRALFNVLRVVDDKKGWSMRAGFKLRSMADRHPASTIIVSGPPISPLYAAVYTARRLKRPIIVDMRDPITEIGGSDVTRLRSPALSARGFVERYVVENADAIVTTTPGLADRLRARYPAAGARISCIYNGFDGDLVPARFDTGNFLTIVFAGELYLNRNPFPFLEAIDRLLKSPAVDESRIRVIFAGQCESHAGISLREWSSSRPSGRVLTIHGRLDAAGLRRLYQDATLLLNFAEGQPIQVPAKTFELLSLGREVLVACEPDSDTSKVIAGIDGVFGVQLGETQRLDDLLQSFYRRHVVEGRMSPPSRESVLRYSRGIQNENYSALIDRVSVGVRIDSGDG